jgi:organic hydroperoxide reductase OsmC/OhrA
MDQSPIRQKSFTFRTSATWDSAKSGVLHSEGKPALNVSSPPEFNGERGHWTPEDLFVGSVELCHMTTFLNLARKQSVPLLSYTSHANGVLEFVEGDYRFTRIVIFPRIVVSKSVPEAEVHALLREAERHCLVARSIASIVEVNPTIILQ